MASGLRLSNRRLARLDATMACTTTGRLDWLRAEIDVLFEGRAGAFLQDPWAARDAYIDVVLDRSARRIDEFCLQYSDRVLAPAEQQTVLKLLELQRQRLLMFTSCG